MKHYQNTILEQKTQRDSNVPILPTMVVLFLNGANALVLQNCFVVVDFWNQRPTQCPLPVTVNLCWIPSETNPSKSDAIFFKHLFLVRNEFLRDETMNSKLLYTLSESTWCQGFAHCFFSLCFSPSLYLFITLCVCVSLSLSLLSLFSLFSLLSPLSLSFLLLRDRYWFSGSIYEH